MKEITRKKVKGRAAMLAVLVTAVVCLLGVLAPVALADLGVGDAAPSFSATTIDGQAVSLASYHGKPTVLLFWGSW